ncbi:hypothetical protein BJ165DRAFT_1100687 [Panaeolus papilionaceus]|nr:hypothetical protein BJ165DRAFT_1100687 [Panaeolus papilionaceus]
MDLCDLLQTMSLGSMYASHGKAPENAFQVVPQNQSFIDAQPVEVSMAIEEPVMHVQPVVVSQPSNASSNTLPTREEYPGCGYLQAIRGQIEEYQTTGGEYLDSIFTHREIMSSYPSAHQKCSRAFTEISSVLEKRAWRADREADTEAVAAFRHEAWVIWSAL